MDMLTALVPPAEQALVSAQARHLVRDAGHATWPDSLRPGDALCHQVSLVVAAVAPHLPPPRLALLVRHALWSFLLDDRFDKSGVGLDALEQLQREVAAVVAGRPAAAVDPLATELAALRDRLSPYDRSGGLLPRFDAAVGAAVTGHVRHTRLARAVAGGMATLPTAERYLAVAADSVNYRSFAYALLALDAPPYGAALDRLEPALDQASYAVRLANDLASMARDRSEATLNVLRLHTANGAPVTRAWTRGALRQRLRHHAEALPRERERDLAVPARTLARSLDVTVRLYRLTDLTGAAPA